MSTPAQKANLARIRDNQRRSRARRREYLQELEQRLRVYELRGVEASSEVQQAARRVAEENRQLRGLLSLNGITDEYISHYLHRDTATAQTDPTPIPHFPSRNPSEAVQSLQYVIAPSHESPEISFASVSTPSFSLWWQLRQASQFRPASDQPPHYSIPLMIMQPSVPSQMHPQQSSYPVASGTSTSPTEAYDSVAA